MQRTERTKSKLRVGVVMNSVMGRPVSVMLAADPSIVAFGDVAGKAGLAEGSIAAETLLREKEKGGFGTAEACNDNVETKRKRPIVCMGGEECPYPKENLDEQKKITRRVVDVVEKLCSKSGR